MAPASSSRSKRWATRTGGCASACPPELDPFLVYKGSIAIDGISLTIAALERRRAFGVTIIPHTYRNTTLAGYRPGARVNLECDILAKHVEKLLRKLDVKPRADGREAARKRVLR